MISVTWNGGEKTGFISREAAERFIERICRKMAPDLNYSVGEIHFLPGYQGTRK